MPEFRITRIEVTRNETNEAEPGFTTVTTIEVSDSEHTTTAPLTAKGNVDNFGIAVVAATEVPEAVEVMEVSAEAAQVIEVSDAAEWLLNQ